MATVKSWIGRAIVVYLLAGLAIATAPSLKQLSQQLSKQAEVYLPGSEGFANATLRWNAAALPHLDIIVKVETERDVERTIRYANAHKRPFLAISGGHGQTQTLKNVKSGIGIWMRGMNDLKVVDRGRAAVVGGGIENGEVIRRLWAEGKQTSTPVCDCPGFIAPVLGGGHGWLQGRYGLPADQLISARLVLANGSAISVSASEHKDLFWALRGAGHNFGIVTELKIKIYDRTPEQDLWNGTGFTFTSDKIQSVFAVVNGWIDEPNRPIELTHYGAFIFNPQIDPVKAVFLLWIFYQGTSIPEAYTSPLYKLGPASVTSKITDLTELNTHTAGAYGMPACAKGGSRHMYPVSLNRYPLENLEYALDIFSSLPPAYHGSFVLLEGYTTHRVKQIPAESTAFADRNSEILVDIIILYEANSTLDSTAYEYGEKLREAIWQGSGYPYYAYVNYVHGDETLESIYGYEPWRLQKLRKLKKQYDPFGRFNFYSPIS
ncbi:FAD-binding domain-containing protein [Aaosphaeria arxii CBS 175.79]|uniref:FAD-binding domain-containing protein n=1 Tax=Aaosphaeria arxii CBS 175.79 TaxID=1450172 RepID=A0A6A5X9D8_9PLEO|nr:FAD-binding domain-containing protein [Aaosphaeria arxii CBS 175.79]KAF2009519.1 FAD-binding domain-containing protein [Aaosphaeria arxii CBS 175.79]